MTPTSPATDIVRAKAGFTLLEMLIVLGLMGLAASVMVPSIQRTLSSNADHRETFQFQRLLMDLRATAFHQEKTIQLVDSGEFSDNEDDPDPVPAEIKLDGGWTYKLAGPLTINPRGFCVETTADLAFENQPRVRLTIAADCLVTANRAPR